MNQKSTNERRINQYKLVKAIKYACIIITLISISPGTKAGFELLSGASNSFGLDDDALYNSYKIFLICFIVSWILQHLQNQIQTSIILENWLSDHRITNLLDKSNLSDFFTPPDYITLDSGSKHLILLKEYFNSSIDCDKYAIERAIKAFYAYKKTDKNSSEYVNFKKDIENESSKK